MQQGNKKKVHRVWKKTKIKLSLFTENNCVHKKKNLKKET